MWTPFVQNTESQDWLKVALKGLHFLDKKVGTIAPTEKQYEGHKGGAHNGTTIKRYIITSLWR